LLSLSFWSDFLALPIHSSFERIWHCCDCEGQYWVLGWEGKVVFGELRCSKVRRFSNDFFFFFFDLDLCSYSLDSRLRMAVFRETGIAILWLISTHWRSSVTKWLQN
jgi:hypothetical protein